MNVLVVIYNVIHFFPEYVGVMVAFPNGKLHMLPDKMNLIRKLFMLSNSVVFPGPLTTLLISFSTDFAVCHEFCFRGFRSFLSDKLVEAGVPVMGIYTNSHWATDGRDVTIKVVIQPSGALKVMSLSNCIVLPCYVLFPEYFVRLVSDAHNIGILGFSSMSRVCQYGNGHAIFLGHPNFLL